MDVAALMNSDLTKLVSLVAWAVCLLWAAHLRRWRMTCAFGCLAASAVLRDTASHASDKIMVAALSVFAVLLLLSDVRAQAVKRRARDNPPD